MGSITLIGGGIIIICAAVTDAKQTVELITVIITIRGFSWVSQKVVQALNRDYGEFIDYAGWCIAGVPALKLLKLSMSGLYTAGDSLAKIQTEINSIVQFFHNVAVWVDKVTFWN